MRVLKREGGLCSGSADRRSRAERSALRRSERGDRHIQDREGAVKKFNDDDCRVFLASLKAGGVGIDLTQASVVIHYDRWWNPAKEDQATDRVHRLGQTRGVQVFKLLTLNTIEERIDQILIEKGALRQGLFPGGILPLSRSDLLSLLQG